MGLIWGVRGRDGPEMLWASHVSHWKDAVVFAEVGEIAENNLDFSLGHIKSRGQADSLEI